MNNIQFWKGAFFGCFVGCCGSIAFVMAIGMYASAYYPHLLK